MGVDCISSTSSWVGRLARLGTTRPFHLGLLVVAAGLCAGGAVLSAEPATSPYGGRLVKAFFMTDRVGDAIAAVAASAPAPERPMLSAAADRARQPEPALSPVPGAVPNPVADARLARRRVLAQSMVALVATPEARAESVSASDALVQVSPSPVESALAIEIPLSEAEMAEGYLKAHRDSAVTPFFYAFLMTRYRIAFERQTAAQALTGQKASAKKYRAFLLRAKESTDPLLKAVADDIDAQPWLERQTQPHPRDFDPDACCRG